MTLPPESPAPTPLTEQLPAEKKLEVKLKRLVATVTLTVSLLVAFVFASLLVPGPIKEAKTLIIPRGVGAHEIANLLAKNDVVLCSFVFRLASKIFVFNALQAGEYQFTRGQSSADIALMLHEGKSIPHWFTVAEGLTSDEIVRLLKASPALTGDIPQTPAEGSLLPETYRYSYGDSRANLIARMQKSMQDSLNDLWPKRDPDLSLNSPQEAVTMASVIEKETGKAVERPRIAGVFFNRLHQHMRLQSDPTVIYAITLAKGPMDHDLDHDDLSFASPINTYTSDGLPSQPICNPGRAALEAALHPEPHDFLYFVADGTGGHAFARDLAEHNQNVLEWRKKSAKADH